MTARLGNARHEQRIELRTERLAIAPAVDADDAHAAQPLDLAAHRHLARRGAPQEVERRDLEVDGPVETDQRGDADAPPPAGRHPVEHERQHAGAARVAADDDVRRAPGERVVLDDAAQCARRFVGRAARREVVGGHEPHDVDAARRETVCDAAVDRAPAAVAGDENGQPAVAVFGALFDERQIIDVRLIDARTRLRRARGGHTRTAGEDDEHRRQEQPAFHGGASLAVGS